MSQPPASHGYATPPTNDLKLFHSQNPQKPIVKDLIPLRVSGSMTGTAVSGGRLDYRSLVRQL